MLDLKAGAMGVLLGFTVLEPSGNPLPDAVVTVLATGLPDPRLLAPFGIALLLGWALRRHL